jgi:uncharacterized protein YcbX
MDGVSADVIGFLSALWRYPVKSMMGEELDAADLTERGIVGDRAYALVDAATGKVASAKNPRKWGKLFDCRAAFSDPPLPGQKVPPVRIALPDGASVGSDEGDAGARLSRMLGREVSLMSAAPQDPSLEEYWPDIEGLAHRETITDEAFALGSPAGTFFDFAPIHLLTTATLDRLSALAPPSRFETRRFRPNLVIALASRNKDFPENDWVGRSVAIGDAVRLKVVIPCARCVMTTLAQGDLPDDPGVLRAVARHNRVLIASLGQEMPSVGVYAEVSQGGPVRRGDPVRIE